MSDSFEISIDLTESNDVIIRKLLKCLVDDVNKAVFKAQPKILERIRDIISFTIKASPTYRALVGGSLAGEFGFYAGREDERVAAIVDKVTDSIHIKFTGFKLRGQNIVNRMYIYIMRADFSDILSMHEAVVRTEKGENLPWLEWLLTQGNRIILVGHKSVLLSENPDSGVGVGRSGRGIMVEGDGFFWRVPPLYSGTIKKNWLTKALNDNIKFIDDQFTRIFKEEIEKAI